MRRVDDTGGVGHGPRLRPALGPSTLADTRADVDHDLTADHRVRVHLSASPGSTASSFGWGPGMTRWRSPKSQLPLPTSLRGRGQTGTGCSSRGLAGDALEGEGPQRGPQRRLGRRLEEVAKAVGGGYCRLHRGTVARHRLGALEGGRGGAPPLPMHPWGWGGFRTGRLLQPKGTAPAAPATPAALHR